MKTLCGIFQLVTLQRQHVGRHKFST